MVATYLAIGLFYFGGIVVLVKFLATISPEVPQEEEETWDDDKVSWTDT